MHRMTLFASLFLCVWLLPACDGAHEAATANPNTGQISSDAPQQNSTSQNSISAPTSIQSLPLPFRIVKEEEQKKGGALRPLLKPQYTLLISSAVLTEGHPELTGQNVEATLRQLLRTIREDTVLRNKDVDGITAYLYQSSQHLNGANAALGCAEWWPKNHSFNPENSANIKNKDTYVETYDVFLLPSIPAAEVGRLSEEKRREIFVALVQSEDKAMREAEAKFPTVPSNIPPAELRSYDWEGSFKRNLEEDRRLQREYERALLEKYEITEQELAAIKSEAFSERWPLPKF